MNHRIARIVLIGLGMMIASCLVSLMIVFMRGNLNGTDLDDLLLAQAAGIPVATLVFAVSVLGFVREHGWRRGLRQLWLSTPPWLVFIGASLISLVGIGELSFFLIRVMTSQGATVAEHIPLWCLLSCIAAFTALFASMNPFDEARDRPIGRWPPVAR